MLDRTQTIEKPKTTRQYLDEHYGVHSMTLFGSLARNEQQEDSDVDICVEMVPNLFKRAGVKIYILLPYVSQHYFIGGKTESLPMLQSQS